MLFASVEINQPERRLLIFFIIILTLLLIVLALIGALIRFLSIKAGTRADNLVHDAVKYRVIDNKKQFLKYGYTKNARKFVKDATPAICIVLVSLIFYIIYGIVTNVWARPYFTEFSTVLWKWDFANQDNYAIVWGAKILAKWPELINTPHLVAEYWPSYVLCTLWIVAIIYLLIVSWTFLCRAIFIGKRANDIYKKSLEGFNYYDNQETPSINPNEIKNSQQKSGSDQ